MTLVAQWPVSDEGFATDIIASTARRLSRILRSANYDVDDIEQHLTIELWQMRERFDTGRGSWEGFATQVVRTAACKLLRHLRAAKRDDRRTVSLASDDMVPMLQRGTDLRIDLAIAIRKLSPIQKRFLAVIESGPREKVRAALGISRRKFDSRKKSLIQTFASLQLDEYCD